MAHARASRLELSAAAYLMIVVPLLCLATAPCNLAEGNRPALPKRVPWAYQFLCTSALSMKCVGMTTTNGYAHMSSARYKGPDTHV